eukprot:11322524-Alexandrium_andersonii.AAC.1
MSGAPRRLLLNASALRASISGHIHWLTVACCATVGRLLIQSESARSPPRRAHARANSSGPQGTTAQGQT